jgi:ABC-type dipeptide/oligopeptide/nickel transport system permease component
MKFLLVLAIVSIFTAIALNPTIEEKVDVQLEQSEALHDSAMMLLKELHDKNDSLLTQYFGK